MGSWSSVAAWVRPAARDDRHAPPYRRAAVTRPFREVATRSLARAAFEPLPAFLPEGGGEVAAWMELPRDRQALLSAIATRLDAEAHGHLRVLLARGTLICRDLAGRTDLVAHLAAIVTGPASTSADFSQVLEALIRGIAEPERLRAPVWVVALARRHPAELARLVAALVGPRAGAYLLSGRWLGRCPDWFDAPGDLVGRLLGSACLQIETSSPRLLRNRGSLPA